MSVVVSIGDFRKRGMVAILRELLVKAIRGEIAGFAFMVELKDGTQKSGFAGKYQVDAGEAVRAANRMSKHLNEVQDLQQAATLLRGSS